MCGKHNGLTALFIFLFCSSTPAEEAPELILPVNPSDGALVDLDLDSDVDGMAIRSRFVRIDSSVLLGIGPADNEDNAQGARISMRLFEDVAFIAENIPSLSRRSESHYYWVGKTGASDFAEVTLVLEFETDTVSGNINFGGEAYQIRPASSRLQRVIQIDNTGFPNELEPLKPDLGGNDPDSEGQTFDMDAIQSEADPEAIDALVLYSKSLATEDPNVVNLIYLAEIETNASFFNSGLDFRIRVVGTESVSVNEEDDFQVILKKLRETDDGEMDEIHSLRNIHRADVVTLFVGSGRACGIAYLMENVNAEFSNYAFSVVRKDCATGYYSFGHELGHIMGARHDRRVDSKMYAPFSHNFGYVDADNGWRTIMAYNDPSCINKHCERLQFWSNPAVLRDGRPLGVNDGEICASDNHLTLYKTWRTVSEFR